MPETLTSPMQVIAACADEVRSALSGLDDGAVLDLVRGMESASRIVHSVLLDTLAEVDSRRALTGEPLASQLPRTAVALAAGEIGPAHARVITEGMDAVPTSTPATQRAEVEADLATHARTFGPTELAKLGQRMLAHLDPDGPEPREDNPAPAAGELRLRNRRDGTLGFEGWLDTEHGPQFQGLVDQLAKPCPLSEDIPDSRSTGERQADALLEICGLARAAVAASRAAQGLPPTVTDPATLERVAAVLRLAAEGSGDTA